MSELDSVRAFRGLHARDEILTLPNAWDAASAALCASVGAAAIATSSAGVAWACGYADGDALPRANLLNAVREIRRMLKGLPLTIDIEGGYSTNPDRVAELVTELRALAVAGINLEDGTGEPEALIAKIRAVKRSTSQRGDDIFINARTDVFLAKIATGETAVRETILRAQRYAAAGADGIFVPAIAEPEAIRRIAAATTLPLNVLAVRGLPPLPELHGLGVRRLSAGSGLARLAYGTVRQAARAFVHDDGREALFSESVVTNSEMNDLFAS